MYIIWYFSRVGAPDSNKLSLIVPQLNQLILISFFVPIHYFQTLACLLPCFLLTYPTVLTFVQDISGKHTFFLFHCLFGISSFAVLF